MTKLVEKKHLRWIASLTCLICGIRDTSQAAHAYSRMNKTLSRKSLSVVPLCCERGNNHHYAFDTYDSTVIKEELREPIYKLGLELREISGDTMEANRIIRKFRMDYL